MTAIHKKGFITGLLITSMLWAGCGPMAKVPEEAVQNSLIIDKEGAVVSHMVDVFDKSYYDLEELKQMAVEEIAAYNTAKQIGTTAPVSLKEVKKTASSMAVVTYNYDSLATYGDYNNRTCFYGTVAEAKADGYNFDVLNQVMFNADADDSIVSSQLNEAKMQKKHVILLDEKTLVYCPYKVSYASENAVVREDGSVDTTAMLPEEFPVIILLDK